MSESFFDASRFRWREVVGSGAEDYFVHHDYTILGHDVGAGTLDMVVRWGRDGGHCPVHRHLSTTTVLVLAGEQHLVDVLADGTRGDRRVRVAGDYALSLGDAHPHLECGGPEGGMAFFGNHCSDGILYDLHGPDGSVAVQVTIESLVADFEENAK